MRVRRWTFMSFTQIHQQPTFCLIGFTSLSPFYFHDLCKNQLISWHFTFKYFGLHYLRTKVFSKVFHNLIILVKKFNIDTVYFLTLSPHSNFPVIAFITFLSQGFDKEPHSEFSCQILIYFIYFFIKKNFFYLFGHARS